MKTHEIIQMGESYLASAGIDFSGLGYDITVTASSPARLKKLANAAAAEK